MRTYSESVAADIQYRCPQGTYDTVAAFGQSCALIVWQRITMLDGYSVVIENLPVKRHVIGHNLGVADEHNAELTQSEQPGETVALIGEETRRFAQLCLQVLSELETRLLPHPEMPEGSALAAADEGNA